MDEIGLFEQLNQLDKIAEIENLLLEFERDNNVLWLPIGGKQNNRGPIEFSTDPGRSLIERVTNAIDAVIEREFEAHSGRPTCRSPFEASQAWFNVPEKGLSDITQQQRRSLADNVTVGVHEGDGKGLRCVTIRDKGIGILPEFFESTILSINENNKISKYYLAGVYGQGGSSTFSISKYTFIASRYYNSDKVGFTVVKYLDLPPDQFKTGHYVYLSVESKVPSIVVSSNNQFPPGTFVKHIGYELSGYKSPVGPQSVYGLLQQYLFYPILPIWLEDDVHNYRRVIKGSGNALRGASDDDEGKDNSKIVHSIPMFFNSLGDYGRVGIEYWVLEKQSKEKRRPSDSYINSARPIILTINGQNHAELSANIIKKEAGYAFLGQRLIIHINCDCLSPFAKRQVFPSGREDARKGNLLDQIRKELVDLLLADDELKRLNDEARDEGIKERDSSDKEMMRKEVSKVLNLQGYQYGQSNSGGSSVGKDGPGGREGRKSTTPKVIEIHEPPTYIKILWPNDTISFYPSQRRYLKIETDANNHYHDPNDTSNSKINIIISGSAILIGTTALTGGRMRAIVEMPKDATLVEKGSITVELYRPGNSTIFDRRNIDIIEAPPKYTGRKSGNLPDFEIIPVSPSDNLWVKLGWPDETDKIASAANMDDGTLKIYYNSGFPNFKQQHDAFNLKSTVKGKSFVARYEIWLAAHSIIYYNDTFKNIVNDSLGDDANEEAENKERCRIAILATIFAAKETNTTETVLD